MEGGQERQGREWSRGSLLESKPVSVEAQKPVSFSGPLIFCPRHCPVPVQKTWILLNGAEKI